MALLCGGQCQSPQTCRHNELVSQKACRLVELEATIYGTAADVGIMQHVECTWRPVVRLLLQGPHYSLEPLSMNRSMLHSCPVQNYVHFAPGLT